jgi:glutathione S-transferase
MPLEVYINSVSQPSRTVLCYLKLSGIQYNVHEINIFAGEQRTDEFARINPFKSVPAIVHDGFNVWESGSIVAYLADAHNLDNQWYPKDIKIRARINSYIHWHHRGLREPILAYLRTKALAPKLFGAPEPTAEVEQGLIDGANKCLDTLTTLLADTHYVAKTQQPSIADLFAFHEISVAYNRQAFLESHPVVKAWFEEIAANPIVAEFEAIKDQILKKILG